jgi:GNAT superfamily N-acetyltransferase
MELSTHEQFRAIDLNEVADDLADPIEVLVEYAVARRSWVAVKAMGIVIGYLLVGEVDGCAHIDQVTVHRDRQGQGVGRALMDQAALWAKEHASPSITLTTSFEVPWNRPRYEHLRLRVLVDDEIGPELREGHEREAEKGSGPVGRVAVRLELG